MSLSCSPFKRIKITEEKIDMRVWKQSQANTVNTKMVINILLSDKMSFQRPVKSVYGNEDDRDLPTMTCSAKVAVLGFWRRIISGGSTESGEPTQQEGSVWEFEGRVSWAPAGVGLWQRGNPSYHQGSS